MAWACQRDGSRSRRKVQRGLCVMESTPDSARRRLGSPGAHATVRARQNLSLKTGIRCPMTKPTLRVRPSCRHRHVRCGVRQWVFHGGRRPARKRPKPWRAPHPDPADAGVHARAAGRRTHHHRRAGRPVDVSEAALYRHFASKAQMFEGLIEFIESPDLHARQPDRRTRERRPPRRCASCSPCCCSSARRTRHDARDGGRRAGVRERVAGAHEPVL